jgi:16S rRNA (uracil1498-N3)-methyltransferase
VRLTRVFVETPLAAGMTVSLTGDSGNHVARVLRLREGDALTLFDGRGGEYGARIGGMQRGGVRVEVGEHSAVERESPLELTLLQSIARGERMDLIVQKATELGATRIVAVAAERTVVRLDARQAERKAAHWRAIAVAACEQCGRNRVPAVDGPAELESAVRREAALKLLLDPLGRAPMARAGELARSIALLVGPEGGFTDLESELARRAGFEPRHMGPRVLRTETAAITALAALQATAGDLR